MNRAHVNAIVYLAESRIIRAIEDLAELDDQHARDLEGVRNKLVHARSELNSYAQKPEPAEEAA